MATFLALLLIFLCASFAQAEKARLDFDGDGKADVTVTRAINGQRLWFSLLSGSNTLHTVQWSYANPQTDDYLEYLVPADYDGDGRTDAAVYRCLTATTLCYLLALRSSDNTFYAVQWGRLDPLIPSRYPLFMPQDYDGDGKADPAVITEDGRWYVLQSSDSQLLVGDAGIIGQTQAVRGDFDGDGKADFAAARAETSLNYLYWYIRQSSNGATIRKQWGLFGRDFTVAGDYDGDGKTELAVWAGACEGRGGSYWYWLRSSDNQLSAVQWGIGEGCGNDRDFSVPDDYDGDGKIDVAVRRRVSPDYASYYYILGSRDGFRTIQWGLPTDYTVSIR